jgi:hypothetical protein
MVVPSLREFPQRYAMELARDDAARRRRPSADVWSALEYACHVRDVLLVMRERALQVLREPSPPAFTPMGRDMRVRDDRYEVLQWQNRDKENQQPAVARQPSSPDLSLATYECQ